MSVRYNLFQVYYPKLVTSNLIISLREGASADLKIIMDGLIFQNSYWIMYSVNLEVINCNAASLILELKHLRQAIIQNCTIGSWTFRKALNVLIKNCHNVFDKGALTSLQFFNSSAYVENMTIEHENMAGNLYGILVYNHSLLHIQQSKFINNTVKQGMIQTRYSSRLIMTNCTVLKNHAAYPGVVYANKSFVQIRNTYFNGNIAINGGAAILIGTSFSSD